MMLPNPYLNKFETYGSTRLLVATLDLVGINLRDISDARRIWTIQSIYAPVKRALGGLRIRLTDEEDFVTFLNQRDLEVLLGHAKPGNICSWSNSRYVGPEDSEWVGYYADDNDLQDDLLEREMCLRNYHPGVLPYGVEITRKVHREYKSDIEELWTCLWDMYPETGYGPDYRIETIQKRWSRVEQRKVFWTPITSKLTK